MFGWTRGLFASEIWQGKPQLEPLRRARLDVVFPLQFCFFISGYRDIAAFCSATEAVAVTLGADAGQALEIF